MEERHLLEAVFGSFNPLRLHMRLAREGVNYTPNGANHQGNDVLEGQALFAEATFLESNGMPREEIWDLNNEIVMELQFQALASQILGEFSNQAKLDGVIECAFKKYDVPNGCEFQRTHGCTGRYRPADGSPFPPREVSGILTGCTFEALLISSGNPSSNIDLDVQAKLPSLSELEQKAIDAR
jgi:hypothetical protein